MSLLSCARSRQALTYTSHARACASVARCGGCVYGCLMLAHHTSAVALLIYSTHVLAVGARPAAATTPTNVATRAKRVSGHMQARGGVFGTRYRSFHTWRSHIGSTYSKPGKFASTNGLNIDTATRRACQTVQDVDRHSHMYRTHLLARR